MGGNNDPFYEQMLYVLMPQIEKEMIPSHVLFYLPSLRGVAGDIMKAERVSSSEAVHLFIDKLLETRSQDHPGWFKEFVDALYAAGFEKLAKRLSLKDVKDDQFFIELISLCLPILKYVNPMPIMCHLLQSKVISGETMEEIQQLESRDGRYNAMFQLLLRLPMCQENWFEHFVKALKLNKESEALKALEPLLEYATSDESIQRVLANMNKENSEDFESDPEKLKKLAEDSSLPAAAVTDTVANEPPSENTAAFISTEEDGGEITEHFEYHESKEPSLNVDAPNVDINLEPFTPVKNFNKGEKQIAFVVPLQAGGQRNSCQTSYHETRVESQRETRAKEVVTSRARSVETEIKQSCSSQPDRYQEIHETAPKSLTGEYSLSRRTRVYPPDEDFSDLGLRTFDPEATPSNSSGQADNLDVTTCMSCDDVSSNFQELTIEEEKIPVSNQIFVSNLPEDVTKDAVVEHFGMIGDIQLNHKGEPKVHFFKDRETGRLKGEACILYANEMYANAAVDIFNGTEFEGKFINVEIAWRKRSSTRRNIVAPEEEVDDNSRTLLPSVSEGIHEVLQLRSYQEELAAKAKTGSNCIIVAPTGSGKTHVAMEIIRHHIEKMKEAKRLPKIVFFVPTVALVAQQRRQIIKYLSDCRVLGLSGDQDAKLPMSELLEINDIIVLTPQILENSLKDKDIETLSIFSLMVFDECHHTSKNHPYNMIMSHYVDEKLDRTRSRNVHLPQVVGLTASVGVGKSRSMDQAVTCILKLCANMDAIEICTVKDHIEELIRHVNRPTEDTLELSGRKDDPFFENINGIMVEIENRMKKSEFTEYAKEENNDFGHLLQAPAERGGDRYTQWMSRLQKPVDAIGNQNTRRFYVACLQDLQIYNTALLINADCRTKDALDYIVKQFNPAMVDDLGKFHDRTDQWLKRLFYDKYDLLKKVSEDPKYANPKLNHLRDIICEEYGKAPDSRGIIFCKTREMTVALVNWMNDTPELKRLNPHNLVGSNAPSNKAGMTQVMQEDVLQFFKVGEHQLIIATSVAEEGLDVRKCNIVIRYEHVTNQIARVQSRGRARASNAQYMVIAEKGRGAAEKEECNKIRENMMQKAIDIINRYDRHEKQAKINQYQKEAQVERTMATKGKVISQILKASQNTNGLYTLRCLKCDSFTAYSTDIRKIEASHHVILDKEYKGRIIIRPHPAPKKFENFELTGKIYCKRCHADWGIMGLYKKVPFPVVKVSSLIIINEEEQRKVYKRWKEVPFTVKPLTPEDLEEVMKQHMMESKSAQEANDYGDRVFSLLAGGDYDDGDDNVIDYDDDGGDDLIDYDDGDSSYY